MKRTKIISDIEECYILIDYIDIMRYYKVRRREFCQRREGNIVRFLIRSERDIYIYIYIYIYG